MFISYRYLLAVLLILSSFVIQIVNISAQSSPATTPSVTITRVSVSSNGEQGIGSSDSPSISADGRFVAYNSTANNLVIGDTNSSTDVCVHDRQTGITRRVSISSGGEQGNADSRAPSISADGRYVAFYSNASNLVSGDTNGYPDIFVHDRGSGLTRRVSVSSTGEQGNNNSFNPSISANGRYVTFFSAATNLVIGDSYGRLDVFVHDTLTGNTERISISSSGDPGDRDSYNPSISANGRYVAFESASDNLTNNDTNGKTDIFVHDNQTDYTERVSISSNGEQANNGSSFPSISADGRYIAFYSSASNLVDGDTNNQTDIFLYDRQSKKTIRVSVAYDGITQGNGDAGYPSISADGQVITFLSEAFNLVPGDLMNEWPDIFVHDLLTDKTEQVSVSANGELGNAQSLTASISGDRRYIAFASFASNIEKGDTNGLSDIFVYDRCPDGSCAHLPAIWQYYIPKITEGNN